MPADAPRIDVAAGALALDAEDVRLGGPLPLVAARRYRSGLPAAQPDGPMGPGWTLGFDAWLDRAPDAWALRGGPFDGARFAPVAPGREAVQEGTGLRVQHHADGAVAVFASARRQYLYAASRGASPLVAVRDATGPALTLRRSGAHLAEVTDALGRSLRYEVSGGRLRRIALAVGGGAETLATFEYALSGELDAATDAAGRTTAYRYDGGLLVEVTAPDGRRHLATHDADGRCLALWTHGAPVAFHLAYDPLRQQTLALDAAGGQTLYTAAGGRTVMLREDPAARLTTYLTDAMGRFAGLVHDEELLAADRVDEERRLGVIAPGAALFADLGDDGLARTVEDGDAPWTLARDERRTLVAFSTPAGRRWALGRDRLGRVTKVTSAEDRRWTLRWDGGLAASDALGERWRERHDDRGRPTERTDRAGRRTAWTYSGVHLDAVTVEGAIPEAGRYRVEALADAAGRTVAVEDSDGRRIRHARDAAGMLRSVELDGSRVAVRVDGLGRPVEASAPGHETVRIGYDAGGRLARVARGERVMTYDRADGETTVRDDVETRRYGAAGEPLGALRPAAADEIVYGGSGALVLFRRGESFASFRYDLDGALAGFFSLRDDTPLDLTMARDADGLPAALLSGTGVDDGLRPAEMVRLHRDAAGRPNALTGPGLDVRLELDGADRLVTATVAGTTTRLTWDALDRPTALDGARIDGPARRTLAHVEGAPALRSPDPDFEDDEPGTVAASSSQPAEAGGGTSGGGGADGTWTDAESAPAFPEGRAERPAFHLDVVATPGGAALVAVVGGLDVVLWSRADVRAAPVGEAARLAVAVATSADAALPAPAWRLDALDAWTPTARDLRGDHTALPASHDLGAAATVLDASPLDPAYHDAVYDPAPGAVGAHDPDAARDAHDAVTGSHREGLLRPRPWRERAAAPLLDAARGRADLMLAAGRLDPDDLAAFVLLRPPFVAVPRGTESSERTAP